MKSIAISMKRGHKMLFFANTLLKMVHFAHIRDAMHFLRYNAYFRAIQPFRKRHGIALFHEFDLVTQMILFMFVYNTIMPTSLLFLRIISFSSAYFR